MIGGHSLQGSVSDRKPGTRVVTSTSLSPAGQDPRYDAAITYWSGTFKVVGILSVVFQLIAFVGWWL
jgi:hypothetical protein